MGATETIGPAPLVPTHQRQEDKVAEASAPAAAASAATSAPQNDSGVQLQQEGARPADTASFRFSNATEWKPVGHYCSVNALIYVRQRPLSDPVEFRLCNFVRYTPKRRSASAASGRLVIAALYFDVTNPGVKVGLCNIDDEHEFARACTRFAQHAGRLPMLLRLPACVQSWQDGADQRTQRAKAQPAKRSGACTCGSCCSSADQRAQKPKEASAGRPDAPTSAGKRAAFQKAADHLAHRQDAEAKHRPQDRERRQRRGKKPGAKRKPARSPARSTSGSDETEDDSDEKAALTTGRATSQAVPRAAKRAKQSHNDGAQPAGMSAAHTPAVPAAAWPSSNTLPEIDKSDACMGAALDELLHQQREERLEEEAAQTHARLDAERMRSAFLTGQLVAVSHASGVHYQPQHHQR